MLSIEAKTPLYAMAAAKRPVGYSKIYFKSGVTSHHYAKISLKGYEQAWKQGTIENISPKGVLFSNGEYADLSLVYKRGGRGSEHIFISRQEAKRLAEPYGLPIDLVDGAVVESPQGKSVNGRAHLLRIKAGGVALPEWRLGILSCLLGLKYKMPEPNRFTWQTDEQAKVVFPGLPHILKTKAFRPGERVEIKLDMQYGTPYVHVILDQKVSSFEMDLFQVKYRGTSYGEGHLYYFPDFPKQ